MTWKKKLLLPSLVVLFSLFFSVFGSETTVSAGTIRSLKTWRFNGPNAFNLTYQADGVFRGHYESNVDQPFFDYASPYLTTAGNLNSDKEHGIKLDFIVNIATDSHVLPACPVDGSGLSNTWYDIYDCKLEIIDRDTYLTRAHTYYQEYNNSWSDDEYSIYEHNSSYYFHFTFYIYRNSDDSVSANAFQLYGTMFKIWSSGMDPTIGPTVNIVAGYAEDGFLINQKSADEKMNDKDDQDRADLENQSSETSDDADAQGAEASSAGTTLLGVFTSFVSALATIHETNCRLPSMTVYGLELGQMDLCTFDVPPGLVALATIGMVFIIVPLSFNLARRLVNIFRSFQG